MKEKIKKHNSGVVLLWFLTTFLIVLIIVSIPKEVKTVFLENISFKDTKEKISDFMGVDISSCEILQEKDSHDGFLGDGQTFVELQITNKECSKIVRNMTNKWNALPLTENLSIAVYGKETETEQRMPLLIDEKKGLSLIPAIKNGYYYFEDRFEDGFDSSDDSHIFERNSYNFTLVILDQDKNHIYYVEYDT